MNDDAMIRRENLRALGLSPQELSTRVGGRYTYWRDMLKDDAKPFGEKAARKLEEALELSYRGCMDVPGGCAKGHVAQKQKITNAAAAPDTPPLTLVTPETDPMLVFPTIGDTLLHLARQAVALRPETRDALLSPIKNLLQHPDNPFHAIALARSIANTPQAPDNASETVEKALSRPGQDVHTKKDRV